MGEEAGNAAFAERCPEVSLQFEGSLSKEDIFTLVLTLSSEIDLFGSNSFNLPVYRELISREFYAPIESPALRGFAENCYPGVRDVLFVDDQLVDVPVWCLQACQVGVEKSMWRELGLSEESLPRTYLELIDFIQNQWPALADAHPDWCAMRSDDYWLLFHELLSDYSIYRRCADEDPGYDTKIFRNALTAYLSVPAELSEDDANETPIFSAQEEINIMRRIFGRFISRQPDRKRADVPARHEVCPRACQAGGDGGRSGAKTGTGRSFAAGRIRNGQRGVDQRIA